MKDLFAKIMEAHWAKLRGPTPLSRSASLSAALACDVFLKCEHLQPTGSFKIRGATNKVRLLNPEARRRGVITASTGNHGKAVAYAAQAAGISATVYVAVSTAQTKIDGIRALGAELVLVEGPPIDAELKARAAAAEQGKTYISPYNDLEVVAGQGTLGVELLEQEPELDAVFIAVGGGGLIGGTGTALKNLRPSTEVVGVWADHSPCMLRALEAGAIIDVPEYPTLADGNLGAIEPGSVTFPICREVIDGKIEVTEAEIASGMRRVAQSDQWIVEGSAGVAIAGLVQRMDAYRGKKVAVVLCGRNVSLETFLGAVGAGAK